LSLRESLFESLETLVHVGSLQISLSALAVLHVIGQFSLFDWIVGTFGSLWDVWRVFGHVKDATNPRFRDYGGLIHF
jgi:hypothetical protein